MRRWESTRSVDRSIDVVFILDKMLKSISKTMAVFFFSNSFVFCFSSWLVSFRIWSESCSKRWCRWAISTTKQSVSNLNHFQILPNSIERVLLPFQNYWTDRRVGYFICFGFVSEKIKIKCCVFSSFSITMDDHPCLMVSEKYAGFTVSEFLN